MTTRLHIFRQGCHVASSGATACFTEQDLATCATAYDPATWPAPLVLGHPQDNGPALGTVARLEATADGLYAEADPGPDLRALVAAGRYRFLSASFWRPGAPGNPVPGAYYLRHVGFLGAHPPAVKGLDPVAFAESVIEFAADPVEIAARVMAGLDRPWSYAEAPEIEAAARVMAGLA